MANFKRKRSRRFVRCNMCTDARAGNAHDQDGRRPSVSLNKSVAKLKMKEQLQDLTDRRILFSNGSEMKFLYLSDLA